MKNGFNGMSKDSIGAAVWKVVLPYALFASLWILLSDVLVVLLVRDPLLTGVISTLKGWGFVIVTSMLLSVLVRRRVVKQNWVEANLRTLINTIPDPVWLKDSNGAYLSCNGAFERFVGKTSVQVLGRTDYDLFESGIADVFSRTDGEAIAVGGAVRSEEWLTVAADGSRALMETIKTPMHDNSGRLIGVLGIARDITERKRAEELLNEKHAEMERFIYTVSHDLKSPLITVRTFLGYLEQDLAANDAGRVRQDMGYVRAATDKMERMLGELLEVSRVGRMANPPTILMLRELVAEAVDAVAGQIAQRQVKVILTGDDVELYGDRPRLAEIWQNLIENGVKYMGGTADPVIEIGTHKNCEETVFTVCDNGIGIEPKDREKIFGLFSKLDAGSEGTGLGLALVKKIVEIYQGRIWVESEGAGRGSTFFFTLPGALNCQPRNREQVTAEELKTGSWGGV